MFVPCVLLGIHLMNFAKYPQIFAKYPQIPSNLPNTPFSDYCLCHFDFSDFIVEFINLILKSTTLDLFWKNLVTFKRDRKDSLTSGHSLIKDSIQWSGTDWTEGSVRPNFRYSSSSFLLWLLLWNYPTQEIICFIGYKYIFYFCIPVHCL